MTRNLRRLLKFLHTLGAVGLMGAMATLIVVAVAAPAPTGSGADPLLVQVTAAIAGWLVLPSMALTVVSGLLAIAANPALQNAGWAWTKAATGILIFEGTLHVAGPIQEAASRVTGGQASVLDPARVAQLSVAERNTLWMLLAVSIANIILGIWRPRLPKLPV